MGRWAVELVVSSVVCGGYHGCDEVLEPRAQREREVVDRFFGDFRDFVRGAYGAHCGPEEAGVEIGFGWLLARAVFE